VEVNAALILAVMGLFTAGVETSHESGYSSRNKPVLLLLRSGSCEIIFLPAVLRKGRGVLVGGQQLQTCCASPRSWHLGGVDGKSAAPKPTFLSLQVLLLGGTF